MQGPRVLGLAALVVMASLAGCFGDDGPPPARSVSASDGKVSDGWAYDGQGLSAVGASLEGRVNDPDNAGRFNITFDHAGSSWQIVFDEFAGSSDFQDGGVAFDLVEHGDTGVADTSIPEILARVAAWGSASVTRDGVAYPDPQTGATTAWNAHLMVSDTTVRGSDGRITKADGSAPYDPATPADARTVPGDPQAIFWVKAPSGEDTARAPASLSETFTFQGAESTQTVEVPTDAWAAATINVTAGPVAEPLGAGQLTVRILDAGGNETDSAMETIAPGSTVNLSFPIADAGGPLTIELTGEGAFTATVDAVVRYDDHPFLVLTWDELTLTDL